MGTGDWGAEIVPPDAYPSQRFGSAVDIDGADMIIGAEGDYENLFPSHGSAYVYHNVLGVWVYAQTITGSDAGPGARFGSSVQISGDHAVIGAVGARSAYVFRRLANGTWVQQSKFTDPDESAAGEFGHSVAIDGGVIAIGDSLDNPDDVVNAGAAYAMILPPGPRQ